MRTLHAINGSADCNFRVQRQEHVSDFTGSWTLALPLICRLDSLIDTTHSAGFLPAKRRKITASAGLLRIKPE